MEQRRAMEEEEAALAPIRRGWCLGGEQFKRQMLEHMDGQLEVVHWDDILTAQAKEMLKVPLLGLSA